MLEAIFGECLNYKSGLRILIGAPEVPFFVVQKQALLPKVPIFETQKMALRKNGSMTVVALGGDVFAGGEEQADKPGEQRYPRLTIIVNHHCTVIR